MEEQVQHSSNLNMSGDGVNKIIAQVKRLCGLLIPRLKVHIIRDLGSDYSLPSLSSVVNKLRLFKPRLEVPHKFAL